MESSTSCGICSLPRELLEIIHSYLPLEDQVFIVPKVSRIWRSISEMNNSFKELAKSLLECSIEMHVYNDDQINAIIKLYEANNFISNIKENNFNCKVGYNSFSGFGAEIFNEKEELKNLSLYGRHESYDGYSNYFHINWCPNTLKLSMDKGKWGDFRTAFAIRTNVLKLSYQEKKLFKMFKLAAYPGPCETGGLTSWKWIREEEIKPKGMNRLIENSLDLQVKMYVLHLTHMNMCAISKINSIEDIESGLRFQCNKNGRIVDEAENDGSVLTIKIEKIKVSGKNMSVLIWESSDYNEERERCCKVTDLMRWSVFSSTCEKLAEKLGIRIMEKSY